MVLEGSAHAADGMDAVGDAGLVVHADYGDVDLQLQRLGHGGHGEVVLLLHGPPLGHGGVGVVRVDLAEGCARSHSPQGCEKVEAFLICLL